MKELIESVDKYAQAVATNKNEINTISKNILDNIGIKNYRDDLIKNINELYSSRYSSFYGNNLKDNLNEFVQNINRVFNEKYIINEKIEGKIYNKTLTIEQFMSVLKGLNISSDGVNLYDQDEIYDLIDEGMIGIYVKSDYEISIANIPISPNDPLQVKALEQQIKDVLEQQEKERSINQDQNKINDIMDKKDIDKCVEVARMFNGLDDEQVDLVCQMLSNEKIQLVIETLDQEYESRYVEETNEIEEDEGLEI